VGEPFHFRHPRELLSTQLSSLGFYLYADRLPIGKENREVVSASRDRGPAIGARVDVLDSWTLPVAPRNYLVV
jgi:hypothetical protein